MVKRGRLFTMWLGIILILLLVVSASAEAQVIVYPTSIIASNTNRFGTFYVSNKSDRPQQITLSFRFGYPASDSLGNIFMQYKDSINAPKYSCANWIKSYPRKFILPPGQRQTVRMLLSPPADLKDGVYWTRLVTNSKPQVDFPDTSKKGVVTHIVFAIDHVTSVMFRNGKVNARTQIQKMNIKEDSTGNMEILVHLHRDGNAPFIGNTVLQIIDRSGKVIKTFDEPIAVYFDMIKKFKIDPENYKSGSYSAVLTLNSKRDIIQNDPELIIKPVSKEISFQLK
ncbi:MAG TPA: hypothetical protein VKA34_18975 [Balneolales bacterium]|nr:hypothetical protein [Balneolales bacterium]